MKKERYLWVWSLTLLLAISCSKNDSGDEVLLPSNLVLQTTPGADGSGIINVTATAQNANYLLVFFGETSNEAGTVMTGGNASHTYAASGTYTIKVEAHTTPNAYISQSKTVTIIKAGGGDGDPVIPTTGYTTPETYAGMTLTWQDEFSGTALNESDWTYELGNGTNGWGNHELEYYKKENTTVKDGYLIITAKKESASGFDYTSSRIKTEGKKTFKFGRIDIRAALPKGQGIWPALWLLGSNIGTVGWPKCGEIDIMEMVGGTTGDKTVYGTPHWWDTDAIGHASYGGHYSLSSGTFADKFHVFSIIWTADEINWYVDDVKFHTIDITPTEAPERFDEFRNNYFVIFNVAVGGDWPQAPNSSTTFPQAMIVDYIRIFQ